MEEDKDFWFYFQVLEFCSFRSGRKATSDRGTALDQKDDRDVLDLKLREHDLTQLIYSLAV